MRYRRIAVRIGGVRLLGAVESSITPAELLPLLRAIAASYLASHEAPDGFRWRDLPAVPATIFEAVGWRSLVIAEGEGAADLVLDPDEVLAEPEERILSLPPRPADRRQGSIE